MKTVVWIAVFIAVYSALKLDDCEKTHTTQTPATEVRVPEEYPADAINEEARLMAGIDPDEFREPDTH